VLFFYNKTVLAKYHLAFPQTVPEMLSDVKILAAHNTALIGLATWTTGKADVLEYFADRERGPSVFLNIQANKKNAWSNPAIVSALKDIQTLVRTTRSRLDTTRSAGELASSTPLCTKALRHE